MAFELLDVSTSFAGQTNGHKAEGPPGLEEVRVANEVLGQLVHVNLVSKGLVKFDEDHARGGGVKVVPQPLAVVLQGIDFIIKTDIFVWLFGLLRLNLDLLLFLLLGFWLLRDQLYQWWLVVAIIIAVILVIISVVILVALVVVLPIIIVLLVWLRSLSWSLFWLSLSTVAHQLLPEGKLLLNPFFVKALILMSLALGGLLGSLILLLFISVCCQDVSRLIHDLWIDILHGRVKYVKALLDAPLLGIGLASDKEALQT